MMVTQWVLNSPIVDAHRRIMKDFFEFNIYRTNSDGPMIIHHILSIVKPMTCSGISKVKINLYTLKVKTFDNNMSLANEQVNGWMKEIKDINNQHNYIVIYIFQLYHSTPDPVFGNYIQ